MLALAESKAHRCNMCGRNEVPRVKWAKLNIAYKFPCLIPKGRGEEKKGSNWGGIVMTEVGEFC